MKNSRQNTIKTCFNKDLKDLSEQELVGLRNKILESGEFIAFSLIDNFPIYRFFNKHYKLTDLVILECKTY
jgi:uncharacterized protein with von Willebrand factor type A (vWA) domain